MALNRVERIDGEVKIRHVLISVSDKTGLEGLIKGLVEVNPEVVIFSTGGTYARIEEILGADAPRNLQAVADYTGQPEMQGGLVKTLDFKIYLGLLSETYNQAHRQDIKRLDAVDIDMVVVNLYPFGKTIAAGDVTLEDARTNIDIGGPCMLRASAKNFLRVASVCDPSNYLGIVEEMKRKNGRLGLKTRFSLSKKSFGHTAAYDTAISRFWESVEPKTAFDIYRMEENRG